MVSKVFDGVAGDTGLAGINTAQAFAYKRAVAVPIDSPGDVIYTFASAAITAPAGNDLANGWSKNIPAGSAPLYVRVAGASSRNATDNIAANEWTAAVLLARDGTAGADGAPGASGSNGANGVDGLNVAPVRIYQRGASSIAPALPSATCTFTFATGTLTGLNNGWSTQVPVAGGAYLFTSGATAAARGATDDIPASEWAAAARLAADGVTTYTWVKYANTAAGGGFSDSPVGMSYIGLAYNKATPIESDNPADYAWSLIKGADGTNGSNGVNGAPGVDGTTTYTWIKYADNADGTGMYDTPRASTLYLGLAVNKPAAAASTNKADYTWSKFRGDQGVAGPSGQRGTVTITAPDYSTWSDASAVYELGRAGYGAPINRDVVTLYDAAHAVTKFYIEGAWMALGTVLNGNLLVDGTVAAKALNADKLSAIRAILGDVTAGTIGSSVIYGGAGYPGPAFAWPMGTGGGKGFHLSAAGLLMGDYNGGMPGSQYFAVTADGSISAPGFTISGGKANFSGNVVSGTGSGFRIEMGPDDPVYAFWAGSGAKNDVNAIFFLKRNGAGYFGGALTAGALRTAVTSPEINPNAQLINGPFGSNGGLITVICSFDWQRSLGSTRAKYTAGAGSTQAVVRLYRGLAGAAADTLLATSAFTGPPAAIENTVNFDEPSTCRLSVSGAFTFTDDARSAADHTYRVTVAMVEQAVTIGARPGADRPPENAVYQRLSNTTVE